MYSSEEIRKRFLKFFQERGHQIVPSASLIPLDQTVLLTSAGMQQFVPYLSGEKSVLQDFKSRHLTSSQKCFRTLDIDSVGDDIHHTFFEMLGNWSIGEDSKKGYFKAGAIELALDFFIQELGLNKDKLWVTVFKGNEFIPEDEESIQIWQKNGIPLERIKEFGEKDNFWIAGDTGPCGPCSEIHYDRGSEFGCDSLDCGPNCPHCDRFVEAWNLVFMEYEKDQKGNYHKLSQKNVDTGAGLERLTAILQKKKSSFETDLFVGIIKKMEEVVQQKYEDQKRIFRIISDHIRGIVFLIAEGILPSNVERGYILRRILRRSIRYGQIIKAPGDFLLLLAKEVIKKYSSFYPELEEKQEEINKVIRKEENKFNQTLQRGLKEFDKLMISNPKIIGAKEAFKLYQSYGFPLELIKELARERKVGIDQEGFERELKKHQEISRKGSKAKFGGVDREAGYMATKLHTATHLLHQALRVVLGKQVQQMGSDINAERLRFDFFHNTKMDSEEIDHVERMVNQKIEEDLKVKKEEMSYQEAVQSGALAFFKEKYPEKVSVYSVGSFSKEICAGPHVKHTAELGKFKIIKESSSSAGVRRIKAVLLK
ncbi:alanine--tRNA ligase [Patescibacteria group bacterium]|nr:alanine--tRNA ligase [Patescibacteria group bacterium]